MNPINKPLSYTNVRSISRALNRLNLIMARKSTGRNRQVKLNIAKAQEKLLIFKTVRKE